MIKLISNLINNHLSKVILLASNLRKIKSKIVNDQSDEPP